MKKTIVKFLSACICTILIFNFTACEDKQSGITVADIWAVTPSEKVLSDKSASDYESCKLEKVRIDAVRNEYENGQIIVSANEELSFTVELSDLVNTNDSEIIISKSNFKVYTEMYLPVEKNTHGNGASTGNYPDAILPQEKAVEYNVNKVAKGQNGCAYLEFYIPKDAEAGLYTGEATVKIGNNTEIIPIEAKIYDYTLSDATTSKSIFVITAQSLNEQEFDSTQEMVDKYIALLAKSRLTPHSYSANLSSSQYCERAIKYLDNGGSTIAVRHISYGDYLSTEWLYKDLIEFAELSLRDNKNYLDLCVYYNGVIDEPWGRQFSDGIVESNIKMFDETIVRVKNALSERDDFKTDFGKELIKSVDNVKHLITDYKVDKGNEMLHRNKLLKNADGSLLYYDGKDVTLCPEFNCLLSENDLEDYHRMAEETGNEFWWYGCCSPRYPYPSYHLEDTLANAMLISWMMAEYDIVGNLYWSMNCWIGGLNGPVGDPYKKADYGFGANGEGILCYPGRPFGIEGPVSTIRMEAIRDGNEDYEIIKDLQRIYKEKGKDFNTELKNIRQELYNLSIVSGNSINFEQSRRLLLECLEK